LNYDLCAARAAMMSTQDLEEEYEPLLSDKAINKLNFSEIYKGQEFDLDIFHSDSNLKTLFHILSHQFSLTFFILPIALKQIGQFTKPLYALANE
jgi:hypothetical protein